MNYLKLYKKIIEKAKKEGRKKGNGVYYEKHHIIPDFMFKNRKRKGPKGHLNGNPNDPKNLVLLTPREHILCHVLLAKGLNGRKYWVQAASSLTWFFTKVIGSHPRQKQNIAGLMRKYEIYRKIGLSGISKARKNKFPAIDAITRESIGSVDKNHPKVISGEWVHVTKGRILSANEIQNRKKTSIGNKNSNSRIIDVDYIKEKMIEYSEIVKSDYDNNFISKKFIKWFDEQNHDIIFYRFRNSDKNLKQKITGISKKFLDISKLAKEVSEITKWNISRYGMGAKFSRQKPFMWYTNGKENIQIKNNMKIPENFYRGRTLNVKN